MKYLIEALGIIQTSPFSGGTESCKRCIFAGGRGEVSCAAPSSLYGIPIHPVNLIHPQETEPVLVDCIKLDCIFIREEEENENPIQSK
jgi:hypothetical protein